MCARPGRCSAVRSSIGILRMVKSSHNHCNYRIMTVVNQARGRIVGKESENKSKKKRERE